MGDQAKQCIDETKNQMQAAILHLEKELMKVRAGKASPQMLDSIIVEYYGTMTPLSQVANISTPDAKTIVVQPWDKSVLTAIEKTILNANLGFNPKNDGMVLRITVPTPTEERRKELVKKAKTEAENAKVSVRNIRRDMNEMVKKLQKSGLPEDVAKNTETEIQNLTNTYTIKIEQVLSVKEKDIMTV